MCLMEVYTDEDMNRIVEELPEVVPGVVEVWKAVEPETNGYKPIYDYGLHKYSPSVSIAHQKVLAINIEQRYWSGYHFLLNLQEAEHFGDTSSTIVPAVVIKCFVLKGWITAVGKSARRRNAGNYYPMVIIASQAFFPTYPETEAKLEDFLAWLKDNDKEYAESQMCEAVK